MTAGEDTSSCLDPTCPCQDGDQCHYEGDDPMTPPTMTAGDDDLITVKIKCRGIDWIEAVRYGILVVCELPAGHEGSHHAMVLNDDGLTVRPHEWEPVRA